MPMTARVDEKSVDERAALSEPSALTAAACLFHGFSDPSRLAILQHLSLGEHRVVDLTAHLGLAQSTVSKHLACLRDCGLVTSRPEGRASMWSLNHTETVIELLAAAERLLALTGDAVTLCPHHGPHLDAGRTVEPAVDQAVEQGAEARHGGAADGLPEET